MSYTHTIIIIIIIILIINSYYYKYDANILYSRSQTNKQITTGFRDLLRATGDVLNSHFLSSSDL